MKEFLSRDQLRLYNLVWERFVASQMAAAIYDTLTIDITASRYGLRSTGSHIKFAGFMAVYTEGSDDDEQEKEITLPNLTIGQELKLSKVLPVQHFTQPPPRYTEASLIKILEEKGIGRPSTYVPIIHTIIERGYVERIDKKFQPTELGFVVVDLLKHHFPDIVDAEFTASLEDQLDDVAEGEMQHTDILQQFYDPFSITLNKAEEEIGQVELPVEVSDVLCENCGRNMVVKHGRYGNFLACPGFPECRNTKPILKATGVPCPKCSGEIVERRTKRGKVFFGCQNYPQCDFVTWDAPLQQSCATCGSFMSRHNFKKGSFKVLCSNANCETRAGEAGAEKKAAKKPVKKAAANKQTNVSTTKRGKKNG